MLSAKIEGKLIYEEASRGNIDEKHYKERS